MTSTPPATGAAPPSEDEPQKEEMIRDMYDDPGIIDDEVLKPLTGVANPHAPSSGIHLYDFGGSFFSQEARLLLAEKGLYEETEFHPICIVAGVYDQYDPDYVRINPRCVVPTLVVDGKVTTDAHNMVRYAEDTGLGGADAVKLIPDDADERKLVDEYFELAASVFVESLSYGDFPNNEEIPAKPWAFQKLTKGNHEKKRNALLEHIAKYGSDDPELKAAYEGKLRLMDRMVDTLDCQAKLDTILEQTKTIIAKLNQQLLNGPVSKNNKNGDEDTANTTAKTNSNWLCGPSYSMADMLWGLTLFRLKWRGLDKALWPDMPAVDAYAERVKSRPAFQKAVVSSATFPNIAFNIVKRKIEKGLGVKFPTIATPKFCT